VAVYHTVWAYVEVQKVGALVFHPLRSMAHR